MSPAVQVESLSKAYRIGLAEKVAHGWKEQASQWLHSPLKQLRRLSEDWSDAPDTFWALRDASFTIDPGEVVGVIGRNGAGKSTLLKILSRIVEPTGGRAVMRGRVSSLLEVGTGFHPELTGRENIYLNGAILGMSRAEINAKFDDIVEFSEIGRFLDTPVKRYSSGMYVRLAFAVAAHLDPQIMIVDEVLAVGDAAFQNKCLGKMDDVVKEGRTVLFVSHQMNAVAGLCGSVMIVKDGRVGPRLPTEEGIAEYLGAGGQQSGLSLVDRPRTQDRKREAIFHHLEIRGEDGALTHVVPTGGGISFEIGLKDFDEPGLFTCGVALRNRRGQRVAFFHSEYHSGMTMRGASRKTLRCDVPRLPLGTGTYAVELVLSDGYKILERVERAADLEIIFSDLLGTGKIPNDLQSSVILPASWNEIEGSRTSNAGRIS